MAVLTSPGLASGLDVTSIVQKLVDAERTPQLAQLTSRETKATTQISALGSLKGQLSTFRTALDALRTATSFGAAKATLSDSNLFSVATTAGAPAGIYDIEVVSTATTQRLASGAFGDGRAAFVGTGTLTVTVGAKSFEVTLDGTTGTLAGIRDAINKAAGNAGVSATIIDEVGGSRLLLTGTKTGAANAFTVSASGGDGGLAQLAYDPGAQANPMTLQRSAADAHVKVAGFDRYSASNFINDVVEGVNIDLKAAGPANYEVTLTVEPDDAAITDKVKKFVTEYNALQSQMARLRAYNPATKSAGPLLGDSMLRSIEAEVANLVGSSAGDAGAAYRTLSSVGLARGKDGTLQLDETKFDAALEKDRAGVTALFSGTDGIATRLYAAVDLQLSGTGSLEARSKTLQKRLEGIQDAKESLDLRMAKLQERYLRQFTSLDSVLAGLQSTASFMTNAINSWNKG